MRGDEDHGRSAVLQRGEHSARAAAARAHRRRSAHRVAARRRCRTSGASSPAPARRRRRRRRAAARARHARRVTRSSPTRSAASSPATIVQEFYKGVGARRSDSRRDRCRSAFVRLVARNRRRYGGYIVHAGIVMLFAAFAGLAFKKEHDVTLKAGEAFDDDAIRTAIAGGSSSQGVSHVEALEPRRASRSALETFRDGKRVGVITSEKRQYFDSAAAAAVRADHRSRHPHDARSWTCTSCSPACAATRRPSCASRSIRSCVWVWIGGFVMMIGGLIVMWPQAERARAAGGLRRRARAGAEPAARARRRCVMTLMSAGNFSRAPPRVRRRRSARRRARRSAPARRRRTAPTSARHVESVRDGSGRRRDRCVSRRSPARAPSMTRRRARRARASHSLPVRLHARRLHLPHDRLSAVRCRRRCTAT